MTATAEAPAAKTRQRPPRLISPTHVRALLLAIAERERHHQFTRVSAETLALIEGKVREYCAQIAKSAPSKGVTL